MLPNIWLKLTKSAGLAAFLVQLARSIVRLSTKCNNGAESGSWEGLSEI